MFSAITVFLQATRLKNYVSNIQTAKNLWNAYDMIEEQFKKLDSFFKTAQINLQTRDRFKENDEILVKIFVAFLNICGIATGYAKDSVFKRCLNLT